MISLNSHYPNINYPNNALSIKKDENNEYAYAKKDEPKSEEDAFLMLKRRGCHSLRAVFKFGGAY